MITYNIPDIELTDYRMPDVTRYSVWVYGGDDIPKVYMEKMPNTDEIWMEFYSFTHFYWVMMEKECVDEYKSGMYYNFTKTKRFMLRYLFAGTNFPGVKAEYDEKGMLTEKAYQDVIRIHPRILRALFEKVRIFPPRRSDKETKDIEKQCYSLFCKGESVQSPHPDVTIYCNLVAFWEKFGLNYFDIMKMPQELFSKLKYIMVLDNENKSQAIENRTSSYSPSAKKPPYRRR